MIMKTWKYKTMLICLLLVFCSGFASCGDDEKEDEMRSYIVCQIKFNGAVKVKPDSLEYNPIVLTYAKAHFKYPMPTPVD